MPAWRTAPPPHLDELLEGDTVARRQGARTPGAKLEVREKRVRPEGIDRAYGDGCRRYQRTTQWHPCNRNPPICTRWEVRGLQVVGRHDEPVRGVLEVHRVLPILSLGGSDDPTRLPDPRYGALEQVPPVPHLPRLHQPDLELILQGQPQCEVGGPAVRVHPSQTAPAECLFRAESRDPADGSFLEPLASDQQR